jgi:hypothetical protein
MQVEERRYKPSPEFSRQANAQPEIYERGFEEFWTQEATVSPGSSHGKTFMNGSRHMPSGISAAS